MSVGVHMIAYGGRDDGLFRAGIMESGSLSAFPTLAPPASNASKATFSTVATAVGCGTAADKLACIRGVPYETIYAAFNPANNGSLPNLPPVIDGTLIPENPIKSVLAGKYVHVPTIIGANEDEGSLFAVFPPKAVPNTDADVKAYLTGFSLRKSDLQLGAYPYYNASVINTLMQLYPNIPSLGVPYGRFDNISFPALGLQWRRVASLVGDIVMIGPTRWMAEVLSSTSGHPVFKYRFNVTNPIAGFPDYDGSAHGVEVNFVFNDPDLKNTTELARVTDFMARSWVSFAVDLTPNNHGLANIPVWGEYDTSLEGEEFVVKIDSLSTEPDTFREEGIALINAANVDFVDTWG